MDRLDLRLVEYFIAVAEELHFGRAAARLHIAQPSLSQQIRRLEDHLGVALFQRDSRNVELTTAGEALLREGRETLRQARRTIQATRTADGERLTIGFYGSAANRLLVEVLRVFGERHPRCQVSVREGLLGRIDDLLDGSVDLAFTRLLPGQTGLEATVLAEEPRLVALPRGHRLAERDTVRLAELRHESFIVNPAVPDDGPPERWLAEQRRHGLPGRIAAQSASVQEILALVASGHGVCLVPLAVALDYARPGVGYVPVLDAEPAVVSLAWRPGPLPAVAQAFIALSRQAAAGMPHPAQASADTAPSPSL